MKIKILISITTVICLLFTTSACSPGDDKKVIVNYTSLGSADFTITNTSTGGYIEGQGIVIGIPEKLLVRQGDVLKLSYTPPAEYAEYTWKVTFDLIDVTETIYSPYTMDYAVENVNPGEYLISCNGAIEDDAIEFSGTDYASVYINVVN